MIAIIGAITFFIAMILYVLLVLGFPLGEFAMGGKYKVMPKQMRIACAVSVLVQIFAIIILLQTANLLPLFFTWKVTKGICFFFAAYLSLNAVMNAFSNSKKEKYIVTPISIVTAICFWITAITT